MATHFEQPPQRTNAYVLPDLLALDLQSESRGCRRASSKAVEDKENINPNSLKLQKKQRLAKARAAKAAAASAAESAIAPAAVVAPAAPAAASSSAPSPELEPTGRGPSHIDRLGLRKDRLVSPPLAEMQGRHASFTRRARAERGGSSLRDGFVCGEQMEIESPAIR